MASMESSSVSRKSSTGHLFEEIVKMSVDEEREIKDKRAVVRTLYALY
jgi:hypothetical protein